MKLSEEFEFEIALVEGGFGPDELLETIDGLRMAVEVAKARGFKEIRLHIQPPTFASVLTGTAVQVGVGKALAPGYIRVYGRRPVEVSTT